MSKHEPWFKPRADEEADDKMLDWFGGGSQPPKEPPKKGGWCGLMVLAGTGAFVAAAAEVAKGVVG